MYTFAFNPRPTPSVKRSNLRLSDSARRSAPLARADASLRADFGATKLRTAAYALTSETAEQTAAPTLLNEKGANPDARPSSPAPGAAKAAATCGETITWSPNSPVPIDIRADSAVDFANQIDQALGGNPHTDAAYSFNSDIQNGKMTAVNMTVETSIIRPRYAGGRASTAEQALIKRVETFIKEHEERHRDIARTVAQQAVCDAKGKAVGSAKAIIKKAVCDTEPTQQEALDKSEGKLSWTKDSTGAVIDFKPTGETHNYHIQGCDPFSSKAAATPADGDKKSSTSGGAP